MQKAEDEFNAALKLKPEDAATMYLLAAVHIQNNKLADAETLLNRAKAAQPDLARYTTAWAPCTTSRGKRPKRSKRSRSSSPWHGAGSAGHGRGPQAAQGSKRAVVFLTQHKDAKTRG